ncbi:proton-coupled amino acid transporter-like protein CG1139 isoform X2 [Diabrotica virgifera virgifera]|nr:proton-coupled amino acid transporter-like protein CG1139 isoform X2 [Diabrotica virgifera virgifera]XP_050517912.1 proton-coupled amino acid transporter-like protein CG1139 isoform X2 [Diabrotica virgifera virgifera]XP_050517913.1 proton-coupled amino acid transporter-like protein CG1139 isoform X2 [Diabrotica virgifera virgifera]
MLVGIISTILIGLLSTYCLRILVQSQYELCKKKRVGLLTYPESMQYACEVGPKCFRRFSPYAGGLTNFFLVTFQIGTCCVYVVFVAVNIKFVGDEYTDPKIALTYYILMFFVPFLCIIMVRNLKIFAPFSIAANIITLLTIGVCGYYIFQDLPPFSDRPYAGKFSNYFLYFGTSLFSLQSITVVTSAENNMENPRQFLTPFGVLNVGMAIVVVIYSFFAAAGYWKYGDEIKSSITLNFPSSDAIAQTIRCLYSAAIFISYGLQGIPAVYIIYHDYVLPRIGEDASNKKKLTWDIGLRIGLVVTSIVLATTVPLLGHIISLVGVFCLSALGITFPAIIELSAYWPDRLGPGKFCLWKDIVIVLIGLFGLIVGTYSCVYNIVQELIDLYQKK